MAKPKPCTWRNAKSSKDSLASPERPQTSIENGDRMVRFKLEVSVPVLNINKGEIISAQHGCDTALSKTGSMGEEDLPNPKASTPKKERSYDTRRMIQKSTVHGRAET